MGKIYKKNMEELNITDELKNIYADVSEWLKFAETKHAALFAFWTALLIGVLTSDYCNTLDICLRYFIIIVIMIGGIFNLISFVPFLNQCMRLKKRCYDIYHNTRGNRIFYKSIFIDTFCDSGNTEDSIKKYQDLLGITFEEEENKRILKDDTGILKDYIRQIIEVSQVATIKFYIFDLAIRYTCIVFFIFLIVLIVGA